MQRFPKLFTAKIAHAYHADSLFAAGDDDRTLGSALIGDGLGNSFKILTSMKWTTLEFGA
jgi:hypothetical protein